MKKEEAEERTNSLQRIESTCRSVAFLLPDFNHHGHLVGMRFASSAVDVIVDEDGGDDGALRVEVFGIVLSRVACAFSR